MAKKLIGIDDEDKQNTHDMDIEIDNDGVTHANVKAFIGKSTYHSTVRFEREATMQRVAFSATDLGDIKRDGANPNVVFEVEANYISAHSSSNSPGIAIMTIADGWHDGQQVIIQNWRTDDGLAYPIAVVDYETNNLDFNVTLDSTEYVRYVWIGGLWKLMTSNGVY